MAERKPRPEAVVPTHWLYGADEVARYMRRRLPDVQRLIRTGEIPSHVEAGKKRGVLVDARDVDAYIRSWPSGDYVDAALREAS